MLLHHLFKELVLIEVATSSDIWPIADRALHLQWFSMVEPLMRKHSLPANSWSFLPDGLWNAVFLSFFVVKDEVPAVKVQGFARALFTQIPELRGNHWKPVDTQGFPKAPPVHKSGSQGLETEVLSTKKGANLSSPTVNFP